MEFTEIKKRIDSKKFYSASAIINNGFLPWIRSAMTFIAIIKTPKGQELFKPIIRHVEKNKRYVIKGSDLLQAIEFIEKGQNEKN